MYIYICISVCVYTIVYGPSEGANSSRSPGGWRLVGVGAKFEGALCA